VLSHKKESVLMIATVSPSRALARVAAVLLALFGVPLAAQDLPSAREGAATQDDRPDTNVQLTLYGWLAGATGEFRPFAHAPTLAFDSSFGEVLDDLEAAFFASAQLRRGSFVVVTDVSHASLSREGRVPPGIPASGKVSQSAITGLAGGRVEDSAELSVDLLAGARLWNLDGSIEVPLAGVSVAPGKTFVDPVIAARINAGVVPRMSAIVHADIGGFGIGSHFTYQLVGTLNYRAARNSWISAGWRHLHLDHADGGTRFAGSQTGPLLGVTQRF
jgi:hypothetical protein